MIKQFPAWWCDCAAGPGGLYWAVCTGTDIGNCPLVTVSCNGVEVLRTAAPSTPRYLRMAVSSLGDIALCGQAQDGSGLLLYRKGQWEIPCPCYAVPGLAWQGVSTVAYTQISATQYVTVTEGVVSAPMLIPIGVTSAGISQIVDGQPVWAQDARQRTIRGTTLLVTMEVQGVVTGQLGGIIGGIPVDVGDPFVALDAPGMDPRLAYSPVLDRYGATSWTSNNEACYQELPPFPPIPPPEIIYPHVAPFVRKVRISPFKDLDGTSQADSEVVIDGANSSVPKRMGWVGPGPNLDPAPILQAHAAGTLLGIACEGLSGFAWTRQLADQLQTRIAWWSDQFDAEAPPYGLNSWDQAWQELYVYKEHGETLPQAIQRWRRVRDLNMTSPCTVLGAIPQYFDRGLFSVQETVDIIGAGLDFINESGSQPIAEVAPFEYARANGITGIPAIQEMFNRTLGASVLGIPVFPMPFPPHPVYSSAGVFMANSDISGTLNYFGTTTIPGKPGMVALYADAAHTTVFSAAGDTRPADKIGAWETGKLAGQLVTFKGVNDVYMNWVAADVTGL